VVHGQRRVDARHVGDASSSISRARTPASRSCDSGPARWAVIEATTATRPKDLEGSISILGEKGSVVIGGFFMNELVTWSFSDTRPEDATIMERFGKNPSGAAYNHGEYLREVVTSIRTQKPALVDGVEGRRSLELITALYESIETNDDVQLRFRPKKCRVGLAS
jgi:predicted dehydrogenase